MTAPISPAPLPAPASCERNRTAPYRLFDGWPAGTAPESLPMKPIDPTQGQSFEPSAVASQVDPKTGSEKLLVFSDFFDPTLYTYQLEPSGQLSPAATPRPRIQLEGNGPVTDAAFAPKFEAVAPLADGRFLTTTPFNRSAPEYQQVLVLENGAQGPKARPVTWDATTLPAFVSSKTGQPWIQVEGLGVDGAEKNAYFGVRFYGPKRADPSNVPVVMLARTPMSVAPGSGEVKLEAPDKLLTFDTVRALGRREGLADLRREPDGSWLLLTSHEGDDVYDVKNNQGHLFRISPETFAAAERGEEVSLSAPIASFDAKPEGVTALADGRVLVIFDDDREWKDCFVGYERSRAMSVVLNADGSKAE